MNKGKTEWRKKQEAEVQSIRCWQFLRGLLGALNEVLDCRLVKTFMDLVQIILIHRHRNNGLLLSELGDQLLGGEHGPADTRRISNLLHSGGWESKVIEEYLSRLRRKTPTFRSGDIRRTKLNKCAKISKVP